VMSGARASDIPDGAGSVTCLVLSQATPSCLGAMPVEPRHRQSAQLTTEATFSSENPH
jgi:hypothetical protein